MPALSIRQTLLILIVAPLMGAIALTGWLAFHHERKTVESLVTQLATQTSDRVEEELDDSLSTARLLDEINQTEIRDGDLNIRDFNRLEEHFLEQIEQFNAVSHIYFANEQQEFRGAERRSDGTFSLEIADQSTNGEFRTYHIDDNGDRGALIDTQPNSDPRQQPWYTAAVAAGKPTWSSIYLWSEPYPELRLSAVAPIFGAAGTLEGVLGVDVSLQNLSSFLGNLEISQTARTFIVERDGKIVASSTMEEPFIRIGENPRRRNAIASEHPLVRETTRCAIDTLGGLSQIETSQQLNCNLTSGRTIVQVNPFGEEFGLDWLIAVAISEEDFLDRAKAQARATFILAVFALLFGCWISWFIERWAIRPIFRLNTAAAELETHDFDPSSIEDLTDRADEVGEFARVFQEMALALGDREHSLTQQVKQLLSENSQSQQEDSQIQDIERSHLEQLQHRAKVVRDKSF